MLIKFKKYENVIERTLVDLICSISEVITRLQYFCIAFSLWLKTNSDLCV